MITVRSAMSVPIDANSKLERAKDPATICTPTSTDTKKNAPQQTSEYDELKRPFASRNLWAVLLPSLSAERMHCRRMLC